MHNAMPMNLVQLQDMSHSKLLQIGLHTHTHPVLSAHAANVQRKDVEENKKILEGVCQYPITTLSYPHGKFNEDTLAVMCELTISAAFTTSAEPVVAQSPVH